MSRCRTPLLGVAAFFEHDGQLWFLTGVVDVASGGTVSAVAGAVVNR